MSNLSQLGIPDNLKKVLRPKRKNMIDHAKLAQALRDIDEATKNATDEELQRAWTHGYLPTGILAWVRAIRVKLF